MKQNKTNYNIQSVTRALQLMEMFSEEAEELNLTQLCDRLQLGKNYVFRLLATLETRSYLQQDARTGNYRLGIKSFDLRQSAFRQIELLRQSRPVLESQTARHRETTCVAVLKDRYSISASHGDELSRELLNRLAPAFSGLGIRDLSSRLSLSRKATLHLLVTLESQGVLVWEYAARQYRPAPEQPMNHSGR